MKEIREAREEEEAAREDELIIIDGAEIKFNSHLGEFKVLSDVPTTQDKPTGTTVENQTVNFTFYDGFDLKTTGAWLDYGEMKVQENEVLIKKSFLPGAGKMPGSSSMETGEVKFMNSGQINIPEKIDTDGPIPNSLIEDAYFAKKQYTKQSDKFAGTFTYPFNYKNNTEGRERKESIAKVILGNIEKELEQDKRYTTIELIVNSLSKDIYNPNDKVEFETYELEPEFEKIDNAAIEEKLYLVVKTSGLDNEEVEVTIKEKDGNITSKPDGALSVLMLTEEQMETSNSEVDNVEGNETSLLSGKIENDTLILPIQLRPKSNDDLKKWNKILSEGTEDGTYTYIFGGTNIITNEAKKQEIAKIILNNARIGKGANEKIEDGKNAYLENIIKVLEDNTTYSEGDTIKFKLYKKVEEELLYLNVNAPAFKDEKDFLKEDGKYFKLEEPAIAHYHIYHDGRIIKYILEGLESSNERLYKYTYHDAGGTIHHVCTAEGNVTKEKSIGQKSSTKPTHNTIDSDNNVSEGQTTRRVKYVNGDIAEYGSNAGSSFWVLYRSTGKDIDLVRMPDDLDYRDSGIIIKYAFSNTQRRYTGPDYLAVFIGALAECSFTDVVTTGSCFKEASCFPSVEHVNGESIDTLYLDDKREQELIDAFHKFGMTKQLRGSNKKAFNHTSDGKALHNSHLHSGIIASDKIQVISL